MSALDEIFQAVKTAQSASDNKKNWQPSIHAEIDIRIAANGHWYHEGRKFQRHSLVKLFAGILRREADDYFLVTPAESLRIQVDDAPFVVNLVEQVGEQANGLHHERHQGIVFTNNIGDKILLDEAHQLRINIDKKNHNPRPYIHCRDGLDALISPRAYYDLITMAREVNKQGKAFLVLDSLGKQFELGALQ